jgi:hypothetical protein
MVSNNEIKYEIKPPPKFSYLLAVEYHESKRLVVSFSREIPCKLGTVARASSSLESVGLGSE